METPITTSKLIHSTVLELLFDGRNDNGCVLLTNNTGNKNSKGGKKGES